MKINSELMRKLPVLQSAARWPVGTQAGVADPP